jgi:CP family cyanate transporter-like MFS transporter
VLLVVLLVAVNLRAAVTSLGPLLDEVTAGLGIGAGMAGVITMLPALSFAVFGAFTPRVARRAGAVRLLLVAMVLLTAGQVVRALTSSPAVFVITSTAALAGIAIANVLLPSLVKRYFPDRVGTVTGLYSMTLTMGTAVAAATAVPVANLGGGWRLGLGVWAVLAAVAVVPLLMLARRGATGRARRTHRRSGTTTESAVAVGPVVRPSRTRLGWAMAIFFGAQSFSAYAIMGWLAHLFRDAGFTAQTSGLLLAGITAVGIPIALAMPALAARRADQRPLVLVLIAATAVAYLGLALAPRSGAVLWMLLLAVGQSAFPLILALIGLRSRTAAGTVALSAFAQSTGYLIAALGPMAVGVLYELTHGWVVPIGVLMGALVVQGVSGMAAARPRMLEDELGR